ncbi:copper chaperone PCu(A)C [Microvirga flavescens]|uniref:copper chaperone PCu(A)C n=1 Tax=Microvirga flavescens TaxID=2249811 RepID=UPI000DD5C575|nr:copper chaperone PCu(A)C [Microvirga flavescens]
MFNKSLSRAALAGAFLLVAAQGALAHEFKVGSLEIKHPWSRATPAGAQVGGGYLTIKNEGDTEDRLIAVSAEIAGRTEIHEMAVNNGTMTMRHLPNGIAVPAKGSVTFKPGSYHLMLMDLKKPIKEGEAFQGTLTFEKAGTVQVQFAVEGMGSPGGSEHKDMKH